MQSLMYRLLIESKFEIIQSGATPLNLVLDKASMRKFIKAASSSSLTFSHEITAGILGR